MNPHTQLARGHPRLKHPEERKHHLKSQPYHQRSQSMAEVISPAFHVEQPIPLAFRARNAGRQNLLHDQTCYWINFIQDPAPGVPPRGERAQKDTQLVPGKALPLRDAVCGDSKSCGDEAELVQITPDSGGYERELQEIHRQQRDLLEKQSRLEEKLQQTRLALRKEAVEDREVTSVSSTAAKPLPTRRLKGSLARYLAERSEGTVGSLLCYMNPGEEDLPRPRRVLPDLAPVSSMASLSQDSDVQLTSESRGKLTSRDAAETQSLDALSSPESHSVSVGASQQRLLR